MPNKKNRTGNEINSAINNNQDSGSQYHKEHAGNIEGYGEAHPLKDSGSMATDKD